MILRSQVTRVQYHGVLVKENRGRDKATDIVQSNPQVYIRNGDSNF